MIVEDLFNYVKYGDLANIGITDRLQSADSNIKSAAENQLISYINLGLLELYKRFLIEVKAEVIKTHPLIKVYTLREPKMARVLDVYNSLGERLKFPTTVNIEVCDIKELGYQVYMLTNPQDEELVFTYQSLHPTITNKSDLVTLPEVFLEALLNYVGSKAYASVGNAKQQDQVVYINKFEASCESLKLDGFFKGADILSKSTQERGFV